MDLEQAKLAVCRSVEESAAVLKAASREMYDNPELGHQEFRAAGLLSGLLEEAGYSVTRGVAGMATAFLAAKPPDLTPATAGAGVAAAAGVAAECPPTVALLAEYDALPGIGHGCGHNIIGAAAVGAAMALRSLGDLPGRVLVLGCPAEEGAVEGAGGKVALVREGIFAGVDAALMVHPGGIDAWTHPSSYRLALEVNFRGKTAHAAGAPHEGINALEAVIQTFNAINALRQHLPSAVRVHGIVARGGEAPNVVPDEGQIRLYVRTPVAEELESAAERVKNCARGAAMATSCQVSFREFAHTYLDLRPSLPLDEAFARNLERLGRKPARRLASFGGAGSTDMGNVSHVVPSIHPYLAISGPQAGPTPHSREFAGATVSPKGEEALLVGAKALAMTCLDILLDPALLRSVRATRPGGERPPRGDGD